MVGKEGQVAVHTNGNGLSGPQRWLSGRAHVDRTERSAQMAEWPCTCYRDRAVRTDG